MSGPRLPIASSQLPWGSSVSQEGRYIKAIRALPSVIVLAAFMLVISSARDSRVVIDSETANSVRIDDERIVREIRTYGYIPKNFGHEKNKSLLGLRLRKGPVGARIIQSLLATCG